MFVRRAPLSVQLDKEFWRYFARQWPIFPGNSTPWSALLPLLLGVAGTVWQAMRDRKGFAYNFVFFGLNTAGLIVFLNFSDHEVRDRDYFFQSGYHAYAIWIGIGVAWLIGWIRESFAQERAKNLATFASAGLLCVMPFLLMNHLWFQHDRSHNFVARDYAYDMLAPLAPNSFIFTNGDNDTFPLWYIQQVEGFRKDVRIVNLSLLNTDWYIRQLRDEEPKVPINLDDRTVDALGAGAFQDGNGRIIYTNEFMVHHILEQDRNPDHSWKKIPYFAVTVPEHYGYEPLFALQGLVYEVKPDSTQAGLDVAATRKALYQTFQYRGLFTADGSWDTSVYKDENSETLSRNYAAAHLQLALRYRRDGDMKAAIAEMERIARMFPTFTELQVPLGSFYLDAGDTAKAIALFARLAKITPANPEIRYYNGVGLAMKGDVEGAIREFEAAMALDPDYAQPFYTSYYTLRSAGQRERSLQYLQRWLEGHPGDTQAANVLQSERAQLGIRSMPSMPPPSTPLP
jgi:tetratricopeptide (TPR) repeat protein